MHPYINILGRIIPAYGLSLIVGACVAWLLVVTLLKIKKRPKSADVSLAFLAGICGGIIGSFILRPIMRLVGIAVSPNGFAAIPISTLFNYLFGEIVFYGGLIGGLVAIWIYCRKYKVATIPLLDLFAPALALALAIGRIGCHLAGCCYGIEVTANHPLAVVYPIDSIGAPPGLPLLAVPLMEAALSAALCIALVVMYLKARRPGVCVAMFLLIYPTWRFTIEFFRGDVIRGAYGMLTTSQYISLAVFVFGAVYFIRTKAVRER